MDSPIADQKRSSLEKSDKREKVNIETSILGLDFINKLRPVSYNWREYPDESKHYGLIAQEVKSTVGNSFGGWCLANPDDDQSVQYLNYTEFISPLIKAIQELSERNTWLEKKIKSLEDKLLE